MFTLVHGRFTLVHGVSRPVHGVSRFVHGVFPACSRSVHGVRTGCSRELHVRFLAYSRNGRAVTRNGHDMYNDVQNMNVRNIGFVITGSDLYNTGARVFTP